MKTIQINKIELQEVGYYKTRFRITGKPDIIIEFKETDIIDMSEVLHEITGKTPDERINVECSSSLYSTITRHSLEGNKTVKELFNIENVIINACVNKISHETE